MTTPHRTMVMVTLQKAGEGPPPANNSPAIASSEAAPQSSNDGQLLTITESCWNRIHKLTADKPDTFLRVFGDAGGCSGFQYQFELDSALEDDDVVFEEQGDSPSARVTAQPTCAIQDQDGHHYCVLICNPGDGDGQCGEMTCQPAQGLGVCTYDS